MVNVVVGNDSYENLDVVIVTGTCRAGKTLLSQIIGTMKNVEWIEEPWTIMQLPIVEKMGIINREFAKSLIRANLKELFNDNILLRNGNFRPKDLSNIWNIKEASEIFDRLNNIQTRDEVKNHIIDNKSVFLVTLPEVLPCIDLFYEALPNLKVIHVVRNGLKVAENVKEKAWFSKGNLLNPTNNQIFKKYKRSEFTEIFFIPWWIESGYEEKFINYGDFEKGLYYWYRILNFNKFSYKEKKFENYKVVRYEDLVSEPIETIDELKLFLGVEETYRTKDRLARINENEIEIKSVNRLDDIDELVLENIRKTMSRYGYDLNKKT